MSKVWKYETNMVFSDKSLAVIVLILLATIVFPFSTSVAHGQGDKKEMVRKVAKDWISIGKKQYDRGLYVDSEKSLLMASDYAEYLSEEENGILKELIEKTHLAVQERAAIESHLEKAKKLVAEGKLDEARLNYEKIKDSKVLTKEEQKLIADNLSKVGQHQNIQSGDVVKRFNESVKLFEAGQLEQARKGFIEVTQSGIMVSTNGKTAEDYLMQIDAILVQRAQQEIEPAQLAVAPTPKTGEVVSVPAEPVLVSSKQNLLRSYAKAVVNEGVIEIEEYISQGKYEKARQSVTEVMGVVEKNRENLGDEIFHQYIGDLEHLTGEIIKGEEALSPVTQRQKTGQPQNTEQAKNQQEQKQTIEALAEQAIEYIKQQQYEAAIEILKELVAAKNI